MGGEPELVEALARGETTGGLDERTRRLLAYALLLTRRPQDVRAADTAALREAGLTDAGIHDLVAVTAYFNFVNRVAQGLGVELEAPALGAGRLGDEG